MSLASAYLTDAPAVSGARAYLIDGNGRVLASTGTVMQGAPLPDPGLLAASRHRSSGNLHSSYFVTAPISGGTRWHLILTAQRSRLLARVESSRKAWWTLYGAFVLAVLALIAAGLKSLRTSARLLAVEERERTAQRLAHERLHDALTGLPNRALFIDRSEHALSRATPVRHRRSPSSSSTSTTSSGSTTHSATPRVTNCSRSSRSALAMRSDPRRSPSRFGGDEFLILCEGMADPEDALRVARRIQTFLEQPFRVGDHDVDVSCSVGIAIQRPDAARTRVDARAQR